MRRKPLIIAMFLMVAIAIAYTSADVPSQPAQDASAIAAEEVPAKPGLVGVGGCSASACHGAQINSAKPWQSAYTVWATQDRHSQAYAVLFGPLARQIIANLDGDSRKDTKPYQDKRCLGCHSIETSGRPEEKQFLADGIGCEACHGAAQNWLAAHTEKDWNRKSQHLGMIDTTDSVTLASQCVKCHVGAEPRADGSLRDVNHDLIAAGHPRLAFELNAHLATMPPHWKKNGQEDPVNTWVVGRLVALKASLDLLKQRAPASELAPPAAKPAWPEFAEFDCFGCHRPFLRSETQTEIDKHLGMPTENPWHVALMDVILKDGTQPRPLDLAAVYAWVPWKHPDVAVVQKTADDLAGILKEVQTTPPTIPTARLATSIRDATDATNWDQAAQAYLALAALVEREKPPFKKQTPAKVDELNRLLKSLRQALQFPLVTDPDTKEPVLDRAGSAIHFDSPRDYSPEKFRTAINAIVDVLVELKSKSD